LSVSQDGSIGISEAHAWAPPAIKKDENLPSVYVVPFQRVGDYVSGSAVRRVDEYYRTLVDMNSQIRLERSSVKKEEPKQVVVAKKPMRQDRNLEAADKAVWRGKEALQKRKWANAATHFIRAAKLYERKLAILEDFDKYVDAQLFIALSRFAQGYEADAEEALARVVTLRPELIVDKRWRSPEFDSAIKRLKSGLARIPTGTMKISCPLSGCTIYVDGVVKGANTASVTGLPRGHHIVRVTAVGYKPWTKRVFTPGKNQTRQVKAKLLKEHVKRVPVRAKKKGTPRTITPGLLADYASEGQFNARFRMNAMRFCAQAGVDYLVMGVLNRVGKRYVVGSYLYSVAQQQLAEVGQTIIEMDLSDLQVKLLSYEEQVASAINKFPRDKRVRRKPKFYAKWTAPPAPKPKAKALKVSSFSKIGTTIPDANRKSDLAKKKSPVTSVKTPTSTKTSRRTSYKTNGTGTNIKPTSDSSVNLSKYARPQPTTTSVAKSATKPKPVSKATPKKRRRSWQRPKRTRKKTAWTTAKRKVQKPVTVPVAASISVANPTNYPVVSNTQPQQPVYGQPQQPTYQPQQPVYGQPQQPTYQPQQPVYGQPQQPTYQPQQPVYGQPQQPVYGQPQQPVYGQPQQPVYNPPTQNAGKARPMIRRSTPFTVMARAPGQSKPAYTPPMNSVVQSTESGDAWYSKWWVWTIIGTVVAGGVTAGILLAPPPTSGPQGWNAAVSW